MLVLHICDLGSSCFVSILEISGGGNGVFLFLISDLHIMDFALSTSSLCGCGYLWILQLHNCNFKFLTCGFFNCVLILFTLFPKKKNPDLIRAILVLQFVNFICHTGIVVYLFTFSAWLV